MTRAIRIVALAAIGVAAFGATPPGALNADGPSPLVVTRFDDPAGTGACPADCSLRQSLAAVSPGGTVSLPAGFYTLALGQLILVQNVSLAGAGARITTISQNGLNRVIEVAAGSAAISGVTISGGYTALGGGEPNAGVGGGIWIDSPGALTLQDSTITGNHADQSGGGIDVDGALTLVRSTVSGNDADGGLGIGGGIDAFGTSLTIINSTIAVNTASGDGGGFFTGSAASLTNVTIARNFASGSGGGIFVYGSPGVSVQNTILADNANGNCGPGITSAGYNLSSDSSCGFAATGDQEGVSAALRSLQNNGGPTDTLAPVPESPAIDAGAAAGCPATDQRGVPRPQGAACDIGAVERASTAGSLLAFSDGCSIIVTPPDGNSTAVAVTGHWDDSSVGYCFTDPAWSPDGRRLAFVGRNDAQTNFSLWTANYPGGPPVMIAGGLGDTPGAPAWSPDGTQIAFDDGNLNDGWQILEVPSDGSSSPTALIPLGPKNFREPSWSPDGTRLAVAVGGPIETGVIGIYTIAGGTMSTIPHTAAGEYPRWSPDGGRVAFSTPSGRVSVADLAAGSVTQLSDGSDLDFGPAFSPDGTLVAFMTQTSGYDIWTMSAIDGSQRTTVTENGNYGDSVSRGHRPVDWQPVTQHTFDTTTTILAVTPEPSAPGQPTTVSVIVSAAALETGTPSGTVTVTDGTGAICTTPVTEGALSCTLTSTTAGTKTLTATYSGDTVFNGSVGTHSHTVTGANQAPTIAVAASASPNPVTGTTTNLSVLGADDGGEAHLTYMWSASGPAAVGFSANGTNAAKNAIATFGAPGSYTFIVTIADQGGLTATSTVQVIVNAPPVVIAVPEHLSVNDSIAWPPPMIAVAEHVSVADTIALSSSPTIAVAEHVSIADTIALPAAPTIAIAEHVSVTDTIALPLSSSPAISVNEHVSVADTIALPASPTIAIAEHVTVTDTVDRAPTDSVPPVLTLPAPIVVEATGSSGAVVTFGATAIDAVDGPTPVVCTPPSGTVFAIGARTVGCASADSSGNRVIGGFTVTVRDTTPPTLSPAPDITVVTTSPLGTHVTFRLPTATDVVDPAPLVSAAPPSGSLFHAGQTTVTVTASDRFGNASAEGFTVTVLTPAQLVAELILTARQFGFQQALALLENILESLERGANTAACNQLKAFSNQVEAAVGRRLTPVQAAALLGATAEIRSVLGCQ